MNTRPGLQSGFMRQCRVLPALCLLAAAPAFAQGTGQTPQRAEKPRAKKVWTEDDLVALRTSSDLYVIEQQRKAAQEQAAREAEQAAIKAAEAERKKQGLPAAKLPATPPTTPVPTRREDIQKRIDELRKTVADLESRLRIAEDADYQAREDQHAEIAARRADLQEQLDRARADLQNMEEKLRAL
jgi:chromosome segregation ATPase